MYIIYINYRVNVFSSDDFHVLVLNTFLIHLGLMWTQMLLHVMSLVK